MELPRRRRTDPRHQTPPPRHRATADPELDLAARGLAQFLLDVATHHHDDEHAVHLVAVGAPGQPAVLVIGADVIAHAADLLRAPTPRTA